MQTKWVPSPNYSAGRSGYQPIGIVVHIMQGTMDDTDSWFASSKSEVSAHYGIARSGEIHQYVEEGNAAWHAGRVSAPSWALLKAGVNPNLYTIGIEHEGQSGPVWPDVQLDASAAAIAELANRWSIPLDRQHIVPHAEIYSLKPFCPGDGVDLDKLIALARGKVAAPAQYAAVDAAVKVTARSAINVRRGAPNTHVDVVRVIPADDVIDVAGWTSNGEAIHGNAHWYRDANSNYLWAGATDAPVPV